MQKKLKVAVIGTGNISGMHLSGYQKNENVEIAALCDIDEKVLHQKGEKYGVKKRYTDYREMLAACPEIDAVSVCTWNSEHAPAAICALEHDKFVLCEKPMSVSAADAVKMAAAEKAGKGRLMIGFVRRFGNDADIVKDFVAQGALGDLYYAKATYIRRNGCPGGWFADKSYAGGGPLIDLGVHVIDLVRYLAGNPKAKTVYGITHSRLGMQPYTKGAKSYNWDAAKGKFESNCEDLASAMITFENGMTLQVDTSFSLHTAKDEGRIELYGTKGGITLTPDFKLHTGINGYPADVTLPIQTALSFDGLFENEMNHFVDCCLTGKPFRAPAADGVEIMRILDAIYTSAKINASVAL